MIPCLRGPLVGLSIFSATADQRACLGDEVFLRTHMPLLMKKYSPGSDPVPWKEQDLLSTLLEETGLPRGNRLFILYGAAGSGKSETLRWLQMQVNKQAPQRAKAMVRIPRTALDPVVVVDHLLRQFGQGGLDVQLNRWQSMKNKPVSLANQIIWGALADMLEQDLDIIPLSYKLRPIVEANLRQGAQAMDGQDPLDRPVELLTQEQLRDALHETALDTVLPYEQLFTRMRREFDKALLGDVQLVPSMRFLSQLATEKWGVRPILLLDDLVQSMNVYASDLLDYFLTLEEGDWDVVVGLTPASFEGSERSRALLQRIDQLDTIDDRVTRLYLSDSSGDGSSFLHDGTLEEFLTNYLLEFKRAQGYDCGSSCPGHKTCTALQFGQRADAALAPFNPSVISRLFHRLPEGKGKPRYLLLNVSDLLRNAGDGFGHLLTALATKANREQFALTGNQLLKPLVELYSSPRAGQESSVVTIPPRVADLLTGAPAGPVAVRPITMAISNRTPLHTSELRQPDTDAETVRDWLEGHAVNPELLKPLRSGAARFLKDLVDPTRLTGHGVSRPSGVLRWSEQNHECDVPIMIEGVDVKPGIMLRREVGALAFDFLEYGRAPQSGKDALLSAILKSPAAHDMLMEAEAWSYAMRTELEKVMGMPVGLLAHHLVCLATALGLGDSTGWHPAFLAPLPHLNAEWHPEPLFSRRETDWIFALWHDVYRVRDNLFRAASLRRLNGANPDQSLVALLRIQSEQIPYAYSLGSGRLGDLIMRLQQRLRSLTVTRTETRLDPLRNLIRAHEVSMCLMARGAARKLRRLTNEYVRVRQLLPTVVAHQLPDLTPLPVLATPLATELVDKARQLLAEPKSAPTFETLRAAGEAVIALNSPVLTGMTEWHQRLRRCHDTVRSWSNVDVDRPITEQDPVSILTGLVIRLRGYHKRLVDEGEPEALIIGRARWKHRLATLLALLPRRSAIRRVHRSALFSLRQQPLGAGDWSQLERTIRNAVRYWRITSLCRVGTRTAEEIQDLWAFLDRVINGTESAGDLDVWGQHLIELVASERRQAARTDTLDRVLTEMAYRERPFSLRELSYKDLLELKTRYPDVAERLVVTAE